MIKTIKTLSLNEGDKCQFNNKLNNSYKDYYVQF